MVGSDVSVGGMSVGSGVAVGDGSGEPQAAKSKTMIGTAHMFFMVRYSLLNK